jgi:hypothetical protein
MLGKNMQDLNLEGVNGKRMCAEIIKIDSTVIFASIGSFSGYEIAFAENAAMTLLVGRNPRLKEKYCSIVASVVTSVKQAGELFGNASTIIVNFEKNLRIVTIPLLKAEMFVFLITTRDSEPKTLAFQVMKVMQKFERS